MREVKFRGKRIDNGEWVHGWYVGYSEAMGYIYGDYIDNDKVWQVDAGTLGQYTGLKDKDGTEIYEGDICSVWMEFRKQTKPYVIEDLRKLYLETERDDIYYRITALQVIGNIYDNPELLGGAK